VDYTVTADDGRCFDLSADSNDDAEKKIEKIFKKHGLKATKLVNKSTKTQTLYGSAAIDWLYSD